MKLLFASDIHGSYRWCKELARTVEQEAPDRICLLGDLLYHGPRNDLPEGYAPKQVIPVLNAWADRVTAVRGNCEAEVDQMVLDFSCMDDYALLQDGDTQLFLTHGHLYDPADPATLPQLPPGSMFFSGHTHVKADRQVAGIRCVNPGSVGIPKDGTHSCAVYEDGTVRFIEW